MSGISYYTKEGLKKLQDELSELSTKGRQEMARQIAEARDKGDLSENAEYDAAKDAQGLLELRISQLQDKVVNARIIDESALDTSKVSILSTVKLKNTTNKMEISYTIVSEEEADLKKMKISSKSPIAAGLLGKKVGEIAKIKVPAGELEMEILEIKYDL
jgi:transcription elongation factor GreA